MSFLMVIPSQQEGLQAWLHEDVEEDEHDRWHLLFSLYQSWEGVHAYGVLLVNNKKNTTQSM